MPGSVGGGAPTVGARVIGGGGIALFDVWWLTALAERIPPDMLSRVTSYDWAFSFGLMPFGYLLAGPVEAAVGATNLLLGGAVIAFVALALGLLPRETRRLERYRDRRPATLVVDARRMRPAGYDAL